MSIYPNGYPDQRVIVGGVDLTTAFDMVLIDGFDLNPPEPKFYTVDIPGGNGVIDLTESLGGDVAFKNREQTFTFKCIYPNDFEFTKTKLSNLIHGRFFKYRLTWDPEYTYKGRFSVASYSHIGLAAGQLGEIVVKVSADPYKYLPDMVYTINGSGGEKFYFPSGRKPVHPVVQTGRPTTILFEGKTTRVGIGTFRLNDVLFKEGINEVYFNTYEIFDTKWEDISPGGEYEMTWNEAKKYSFDEIQRLTLEIGDASLATKEGSAMMPVSSISTYAASSDDKDPYTNPKIFIKAYRFVDLKDETWGHILEQGWIWDGLNYDPGNNSGSPLDGVDGVIFTYEWGDL